MHRVISCTNLECTDLQVHNKINVSDLEHLDWEHEAFALQRVTAATISSRSSPTSEFQSSSLFDRK